MIYLFYDYETTGFSPKMDKVIEIAAAVTNANFKVIDTFNTFVNPERPISGAITQITSITNEMVKNAPTEEMAFRSFVEFVNKHQPDVIAGHNIISFDNKWTAEKTAKYKLNIHQPKEFLDTLVFFKDLSKQGILSGYNYTTAAGNPSFKLEYIMDFFELGSQNHRAIDDVLNNIICYKKAILLKNSNNELGF